MNTNIKLLQSYYRFLSLGKYLEFLIQSDDYSKEVLDVAIVTWEKSHFGIRSSLVKTLLKQIHQNPDQKNIFGYLTEISAFRGIFGIMRELLENDIMFKKFVESRLKQEYFAFEQIIRLLRNILSHSSNAEISIKKDDFIKQRDFLVHEKDPKIKLNFVYSQYRKERKWSKEYWLSIEVDFLKLKEWSPLFEIISLHQIYLLSELCYNLCELFRARQKMQKNKRNVWKSKNKK